MVVLTAIASIIIFIFTLSVSGIVKVANGVLTIFHDSFEAIHDTSFNDQKREKMIQQASIKLFRSFFSILIRSALIILFSFLPIYISSFLNLAEFNEVIHYLSQWNVILVTTVLISTGYVCWIRFRSS